MPLRTGVRIFALAGAVFGQTDAFETRIRPVLAARCYPCHSAASPSPQGGLSLDSTAGIRKGGNSGPVLVAGAPDASLLIRALRHTDSKLKMPPGKPLDSAVVADFEAWVKAGAALPADRGAAPPVVSKAQLWSLRKPERAASATGIDQFVLSRLREKGLAMAPEADRGTLIRRATFDLTGLPPSADEVAAFVADSRPDAYGRLVDRLLASPSYGERWGRHWLDVARYADSVNDSVNAGQRFPWSYTYRDWVIQSLNEDLPYNQFLLYQLAADRAPGTDTKHLAALGFLSLGRDFPNSYPETVDDRIDAVARGMMGLTVACARCHDHKYDPIPTKDYYSFYSIFSNIREPKEFPLLARANSSGASATQTEYQARLDRIRDVEQQYRKRRNAEMIAFFKTQIAEYLAASADAARLSNTEVEDLVRDRQLNLFMLRRWRKFLDASKQSGEPVFQRWHAAQPESRKALASEYAAMLTKHDQSEAFADQTAEQLRRVLRGPDSPVDVPVEQFDSLATEGDLNNMRSIRVRYGAMLAQSAYDGAPPRAMSVEDLPEVSPAHVFLRGNPNNPGALTPARFLSCLGGSEDTAFRDGSGRLELARSIVSPENPLTARVIVNRVWMHHFGSGLVRTPSDFGFRGDAPTHPELLDYLAVTFRDDFGWSLKKLHRAIMTSAPYRQSSVDNEAARRVDPENLLLWRTNRRRLEIEVVRDSALAVAGRLDLTPGGVPFPLHAEPSVPRRSVYGFIERGRLPGFLNAFDFASPDQHAPMRFVTTVPQQALFYLNSGFIAEQARHVAARAKSIPEMYRAVFSRDPQQREIEAGERYLAAQPKEDAMPTAQSVSPWEYGTLNVKSQKITAFPTFAGDRWQGGPVLPAAGHGKASLRAGGGEPGETEPVVRRWVSPMSGKLSIEGTLRHGQGAVPYGDGVHGRIVSSRHGELATYNVNGSSADTRLAGIEVVKGDWLDFIVDSRKDVENDGFSWAPLVKVGDKTWSATEDFAGPAPRPLKAWERYAQVLLQTNEFAFVD